MRFLLPLVAGVASACAGPLAAQPAPVVLDDIAWSATATRSGAPALTMTRGSTSSTGVRIDGAELQAVRDGLAGRAGPVAFTLRREPGDVACTGRFTPDRRGEGRCRFTSRPAFEQALATRGLASRRRDRDLLPLALLDARIAQVDALAAAGHRPPDVSNLIAATALRLTGAYVRELQAAGLTVTSFDDLIACRALGIDAAYVRSLAGAGYPRLSAREIIPLRALGTDARYAAALRRRGERGK